MYYVYALCIKYMYMYLYSVYVLCICICKNKITTTTTITTRVLGARGGSGKVKSSKGDNTLREGRKGDPLHKCCGKN